jgi:hypothetical protein
LQTITDEVGSGPISISTPTDLEHDIRAIERNPAQETNENITPGLDDDQRRIEINYRPDRQLPLGSLTNTIDNGPVPRAANDNKSKSSLINELFERGELGINETLNRRHFHDAMRFRRDHMLVSGEVTDDDAVDEWRELMPDFFEGYSGFTTTIEPDQGLLLDDDMEFSDSKSSAAGEVVDFARWCPMRDLHKPAYRIQAQQAISLAAADLGHSYAILNALLTRSWTLQMIGETEGFKGRASASACGKGMVRSALRDLSKFYLGLDRLESGFEKPIAVWPLVGTSAWLFAESPDAGWKRAS